MDAETDLVAKLEKDRRHTRRVFLWLIVLVLALPVVGIVIAYCYDCAPPNDSDMRPRWTSVPLNENGLGQFQEWLEKHPLKELPRTPETDVGKPTWDKVAAKKLIAPYQPTLDEFEKLVKTDMTKWRWKEGPKMAHFGSDLHYLSSIQTVATLTRQRAKILLSDGKAEEAASFALELMHTGRGLQREGSLIHLLLAVTLQSMGQITLSEIAKAHPEFLLAPEIWKKALQEYEPNRAAFRFCLQAEYEAFRNHIMDLKTNTMKPSPSPTRYIPGSSGLLFTVGLRPNRTLRAYLEMQRPAVAAMEQGWSALQKAGDHLMYQIISMKKDWWALTQTFLRGNPGGVILLNLVMPVFAKVGERFYANLALHRIAFTNFALREYELANHQPPAKLHDLVPKHLPSVPLDPFDDKPLRWDAAKKVLYSVGPDMKDDGGDIDDDKPAKGKDVGMNYWWAKAPPK